MWLPRDVTLAIEINVPAFRLDVRADTQVIRSFAIAVGMRRYPTPTGDFVISEVQWNPWWNPPDSPWAENDTVTPPGPGNPMGKVKLPLGSLLFVHGTPLQREHREGRIARLHSHAKPRRHFARQAGADIRRRHHVGCDARFAAQAPGAEPASDAAGREYQSGSSTNWWNGAGTSWCSTRTCTAVVGRTFSPTRWPLWLVPVTTRCEWIARAWSAPPAMGPGHGQRIRDQAAHFAVTAGRTS